MSAVMTFFITEFHMGLRVIGITGHVSFLSRSYAHECPFWTEGCVVRRALLGIVHMLACK